MESHNSEHACRNAKYGSLTPLPPLPPPLVVVVAVPEEVILAFVEVVLLLNLP